MKKNTIFLIVLISIATLSLALTPPVFGQMDQSKAKVLSYSWYMQNGVLMVVGEVQNISPDVAGYIDVYVTLFAKDDQGQASANTRAFFNQSMPQQKAPFSIWVLPEYSTTGEFSWLSNLDRVEFGTRIVPTTYGPQYQGLQVVSHVPTTDQEGNYAVAGTLQNLGNATAGRVWVVATFYNATGSVVALGYSNYLNSAPLPIDGILTFTVPAFSTAQNTQIKNQITDYTLLIQSGDPQYAVPPTPTPPPTQNPSATSTPTTTQSPSTTATANTSPPPVNSEFPTTILLIVVIVALVAVIAVLMLRKRK